MIEEVVPPSVELLESMRSVGYSLEAAISDLIDNSISAGARNIDIDLEPNAASHVAILDDGSGMLPTTATEALRLAGSVGSRNSDDLGRFGLGLKTASLSQARQLTVVTKNSNVVTALRWDIDHIRSTGRWSLLKLSDEEMAILPWVARLLEREQGTLVLWQNLDLLLGDSSDPGGLLREKVKPLSEALSLTFHRFMDSPKTRIWITVNGTPLEPTDPFLTTNPKTQKTLPQKISIGSESVKVIAYTLPHLSGLTSEELKRSDLREKMREYQGFYIYRNRRLISHGHWYGLARVDEVSKQTRILVDVPNTLDHLWQLDIKKSRVDPPSSFKSELRRFLGGVIEKGKRVYTFRGRKESTVAQDVHFWNKIRDRDGVRYEVNTDHPLVFSVIDSLNGADTTRIDHLFRVLANTFPSNDLYAEMASNNKVVSTVPEEDLYNSLRQLRDSGMRDSKGQIMPAESVIGMLSHIEPFNSKDNLQQIITEIWNESQ